MLPSSLQLETSSILAQNITANTKWYCRAKSDVYFAMIFLKFWRGDQLQTLLELCCCKLNVLEWIWVATLASFSSFNDKGQLKKDKLDNSTKSGQGYCEEDTVGDNVRWPSTCTISWPESPEKCPLLFFLCKSGINYPSTFYGTCIRTLEY